MYARVEPVVFENSAIISEGLSRPQVHALKVGSSIIAHQITLETWILIDSRFPGRMGSVWVSLNFTNYYKKTSWRLQYYFHFPLQGFFFLLESIFIWKVNSEKINSEKVNYFLMFGSVMENKLENISQCLVMSWKMSWKITY